MSNKIKQLVSHLSRLPGIGPRQATRIVLELLNWRKDEINFFAESLKTLKEEIKICKTCHNISEEDFCHICRDPRRDQKTICVVEKITDLESIEKTGSYKGLYHVLGGTISPLDRILPQNLNIGSLTNRIKNGAGKHQEVIIATNPNTQGETTALFLEKQLGNFEIIITRLGRGLSAGSFLEYADEITLQNAFKNRK